MNRKEKHAFVSDFTEWSGSYPCMLVIRQFGMNASSSVSLRRALHQAGGTLRIVKNRLVKKALANTSLPAEFSASFTGPAGVVFTHEPVAIAKILLDFAKQMDGKLEVLVGMLDGQGLAAGDIKALSAMPSLEQLYGQLLGTLMAPATNIVRLLKEAQTRPVRVLGAHCYNIGK